MNKHYLISRLRKRLDQVLIPISTIQKFPAQVLSFSLVSSFFQFSFYHLYWFHSCTVFHDLRFIFFSGFRFELIVPVTFFQFLQTSSLFRDSWKSWILRVQLEQMFTLRIIWKLNFAVLTEIPRHLEIFRNSLFQPWLELIYL